MFERYNEKARRTIFFARYEASMFGSPYIETEFLLLGLLREDKTLSLRYLHSHTSFEAIRREIERHETPRDSVSTSVDLPLSNESKHVLGHAGEEADRLGHHVIGTEHLLLGILREEHSFAAALLQRHGVTIAAVREDLAKNPPAGPGLQTRHSLLGFFQLQLKVADLNASIDFYTKLGFTVVRERSSNTAVLTNGSCNLKLDRNLSSDHVLTFISPNMTSAVAHIQSGGLQFEQPPRTNTDGSTTALLRDPDGNIISLSTRPNPQN